MVRAIVIEPQTGPKLLRSSGDDVLITGPTGAEMLLPLVLPFAWDKRRIALCLRSWGLSG